MKKLLVILLALSLFALIWALGGCSDENGSSGSAVHDQPAAQSEQSPEDEVAPDDGADQFIDCTLRSRDASERSDGDYTKVYEINCGGEYIEHHYLYCDAEMTDLRCVCVEMNEDGTFLQDSVYSHIDSVKPGEAIYLTLEVPEIIPNTAIVYTAGGTEYVWLVSYNGRDGGIALVPLGVNQLVTE